MLRHRLMRRSPVAKPEPQKVSMASKSSPNGPGTTAGCGPQCIMLIAGAAAGVLLAVLLVLGVLIYRRRKAQEEEDDVLAEMEDDWRFQPRTMSVSSQGGPGRKFSTRSSRKQSIASNGPPPWSAGGGGYGPSYGGAIPAVMSSPVGRSHRPSLAGGGLDLPRRPSRADLAQMEVYRKMSVIGIV